MAKSPWVRFFASDWLAGTRGLSAAETGVYITLVASMYERREPIADDHRRLARLCGAPVPTFNKILEGLIDSGKIVRAGNTLWNDRVAAECENSNEKSQASAKSANARWGKNTSKTNIDEDANALRSECVRNAIPQPQPQSDKETVPDGTDAAASIVAPDYRDLLWKDGIRSLSRQTGKPDSSIRALVGRWCRDTKDDCRLIYDSIRKAEQDRIGDPIAWVAKAVTPSRAPPLTAFQQRTQAALDACDKVIGQERDDKPTRYDFDLEPTDWRPH